MSCHSTDSKESSLQCTRQSTALTTLLSRYNMPTVDPALGTIPG